MNKMIKTILTNLVLSSMLIFNSVSASPYTSNKNINQTQTKVENRNAEQARQLNREINKRLIRCLIRIMRTPTAAEVEAALQAQQQEEEARRQEESRREPGAPIFIGIHPVTGLPVYLIGQR